jgi:ketosteroid isomerase-like protein
MENKSLVQNYFNSLSGGTVKGDASTLASSTVLTDLIATFMFKKKASECQHSKYQFYENWLK